jgi:ribose 5-phosphate isomerase A
MPQSEADVLKHEVAARAIAFVEEGMRLGLGTGSTAKVFVDLLAERVRQGLRVRCVPTSEATDRQARGLGIDVTTLEDLPELDLTIDGADEYDPDLSLIKGGGGALLREKIVAAASHSMVVIADRSKKVACLGKFPLPVEVNKFGLAATTRLVRGVLDGLGLSGEMVLRRRGGDVFVTDGGHLILDCHLGAIPAPQALADRLVAVPGVVEHGLFIGFARAVITNADGGGAEVVTRPLPSSSHEDKSV